MQMQDHAAAVTDASKRRQMPRMVYYKETFSSIILRRQTWLKYLPADEGGSYKGLKLLCLRVVLDLESE